MAHPMCVQKAPQSTDLDKQIAPTTQLVESVGIKHQCSRKNRLWKDGRPEAFTQWPTSRESDQKHKSLHLHNHPTPSTDRKQVLNNLNTQLPYLTKHQHYKTDSEVLHDQLAAWPRNQPLEIPNTSIVDSSPTEGPFLSRTLLRTKFQISNFKRHGQYETHADKALDSAEFSVQCSYNGRKETKSICHSTGQHVTDASRSTNGVMLRKSQNCQVLPKFADYIVDSSHPVRGGFNRLTKAASQKKKNGATITQIETKLHTPRIEMEFLFKGEGATTAITHKYKKCKKCPILCSKRLLR